MNLFFQIKSFLKYRFKSRHRKGFGIHSPFVFHLLNYVIFEKNPFYAYTQIEKVRKSLLKDGTIVELTDFGTGNKSESSVANIATKSLESAKFGQLLFRLVNFFQPQNILELGTSLGVSTMYLAKPSSTAKVVTMEGSRSLCDIAERNFKNADVDNVEVVCGNIDKNLKDVIDKFPQLDFVYFDANHTREATLRYFEICLQKTHKETVFVFDDIHYSAEMDSAWNEIKKRDNVRLSIDLYHFGLVFFNTDLPKQDYIVAF